jgi:hypothetical protein
MIQYTQIDLLFQNAPVNIDPQAVPYLPIFNELSFSIQNPNSKIQNRMALH